MPPEFAHKPPTRLQDSPRALDYGPRCSDPVQGCVREHRIKCCRRGSLLDTAKLNVVTLDNPLAPTLTTTATLTPDPIPKPASATAIFNI